MINSKIRKIIRLQSHPSQQNVKQRLIQLSQAQFFEKKSCGRLTKFMRTSPQSTPKPKPRPQIIKVNIKQNDQKEVNSLKIISPLPRFNISQQFKRYYRESLKTSQVKVVSTSDHHPNKKNEQNSSQKIQKQPLLMSNYIASGSQSRQCSRSNSKRSDYIIRQRRNQKKLKRLKQKRQQQQIRAKNSIIERLITQKQAQKSISSKSGTFINKFKLKKSNKPKAHLKNNTGQLFEQSWNNF